MDILNWLQTVDGLTVLVLCLFLTLNVHFSYRLHRLETLKGIKDLLHDKKVKARRKST